MLEPQRPSRSRVFIGSSTDNGLEIARHLQAELELLPECIVTRWDHIFEASTYPLDSLISVAATMDFAVLITTPDDTTISRGVETLSPRDNIMLEFGLFAGALGRERTYILVTDTKVKLPSDLFGLTYLTYTERPGEDIRSALNTPVLSIQRLVRRIGPRPHPDLDPAPAPAPAPSEVPGTGLAENAQDSLLKRELDLLCENAQAQGWQVKKNSATTLRLRTPSGQTLTLSKRADSKETRTALREFSGDLRAAGLRVNSSLRRPV